MKKLTIVVLTVLMLVSVTGCNGQKTGEHPFDYYVDCTTEEDIKVLNDKPYVKGVFSFTLMTFQRPGFNNPQAGQTAYLATWSFDNIEYSPANIKKQDAAILSDPSKNPVLIEERLAKAENLSVGDIMYQEAKLSDKPMWFTVAGIYSHTELFAQFEVIVLINDQILRIFNDYVEELGYTNAYIKASDLDTLTEYLKNEFIPHLATNGLSEEEIKAIPREELDVYHEDYQTHMKRMK